MSIPEEHASIFVLKVVMKELDAREKGFLATKVDKWRIIWVIITHYDVIISKKVKTNFP